MASYEALYRRRCTSPISWFEVGEAEMLGPDLVYQAMEKVKLIQEHLKIAQEIIGVKDSLTYEEIPVAILDRQIHKLRTKEIALVKVHWRNQKIEEAMWEAEEDMKSRYPISLKSKRKM
ncbi:uncharacterized protein [Nicotiana tomentosiformis]|uniref:uncharacterized protein n=1 Tax=Nicotiana tomentosiformis TaxID=4098 RepID=UPI00388C6915